MIADPLFYALAVPAVALLGLGKGGFAGAGSLSLPMVAFATDPVQAAAILLPILIVQDAVSVWAFRRSIDWYVMGWTLAGAVIGIAIGYVFAASVSADMVLAMVGAISILFGAYQLRRNRMGATTASDSPGWVGSLFGVASGFTSQIAHAGAPPWQLWVMPRQLAPAYLVGTTAFYFAAVNWIKVPAYLALGQFTRANLTTAAALMPVAIASTFAGVWLVRRVSPERFYTAIYWLMIAVGVVLVAKAIA
ncbi:sulfite exporter TauE/SafE family protein [Sphingomonas sp. ST-64]|uniref:Probable membrane transporter protein n=1 Tax=Sphingomonas plantiphila TaxID=3163295 RepID=A0ABW8YIF6_9SPHN